MSTLEIKNCFKIKHLMNLLKTWLAERHCLYLIIMKYVFCKDCNVFIYVLFYLGKEKRPLVKLIKSLLVYRKVSMSLIFFKHLKILKKCKYSLRFFGFQGNRTDVNTYFVFL